MRIPDEDEARLYAKLRKSGMSIKKASLFAKKYKKIHKSKKKKYWLHVPNVEDLI
jgi:hypothetical protein